MAGVGAGANDWGVLQGEVIGLGRVPLQEGWVSQEQRW